MLPQLSKRFNQLGQPLLEASWSSSMPVASNNVSVNKGAAIKMRPPVSSPLIEPYLNPMQGPVLIESTEVSDDIVFAWNMLQNSPVIGSRPQFSVASTNYDSNGNAIGLVPRRDSGKGLWMGGQVANLFSGDSTVARSVTLAAQAYTLFVWSGSATCSYGTATPGVPLKFTPLAGSVLFTPTGVSKWMLVSGSSGSVPYVPPGSTQPTNAATTGNNGTNIPLDAGLLKCFGNGVVPAVSTVMAEHYIGVGSADLANDSTQLFLSVSNSQKDVCYSYKTSAGRIIGTSDNGATVTASISAEWSANEIHRRYVQISSDGTRFRVGYQRYTSAMVEITSGIQWSHTGIESTWAAFDGSFNPLTHLRLGLNLSVHIWGRKLLVSDKTLTYAEIKRAWEVVK